MNPQFQVSLISQPCAWDSSPPMIFIDFSLVVFPSLFSHEDLFPGMRVGLPVKEEDEDTKTEEKEEAE